MKPPLRKFTFNIPDKELIRDVIAVAKKLRKNTVKMEDYAAHGIYCLTTVKYRFRSWFTVMQLAGLEPSRSAINVPEELLLKNFEDVWNYLGKQPTSQDLRIKSLAQTQYCTGTYLRHFSSWRNALKKFIEYQKSKPGPMGKQIAKQVKFFKRLANHQNKRSDYNQRVIPVNLKIGVFLRDGFRCQRWGNSPLMTAGLELHCHDIVPRRKGGKTVMNNLRTLCSRCNLRKGNSLYGRNPDRKDRLSSPL